MPLIKKPSKLLFIGEHSAVYGFPVIGVTLPILMNFEYYFSNEWQYEGEESSKVYKVIDLIQEKFPKLKPAKIKIFSEIPMGLGLGSSGSLSLCFSEYILMHAEYKALDKISVAKDIEDFFHGKSSGMDICLEELNGLLFCEKKEEKFIFEKLISPEFYFIIGACKRNIPSSQSILELKNRIEVDPSLFRFIQNLGDLTLASLQCIKSKDLFCLANKFELAQNHLRSLGLSDDTLDYIISSGLALGALAGKLSGAGHGGIFFFLTKDYESATYIKDSLGIALAKKNINLILNLKVIKF